MLVATSVISLISSGLSPDPEVDPVEDFLNLFLRKEGDSGDGLGEQDSPRSPPPVSLLPLGHLVNEAVCISARPFIFKLSAVCWMRDALLIDIRGMECEPSCTILEIAATSNQNIYLDDGWQLVLRYVYFPVIHKVHHDLEVGELDVFEYNDRMLARVHREQRLKVRAAC